MLADYAEALGLRFPPPSGEAAGRLARHLPHTATVSNPLDYTTPIWGEPEKVRPVFEAMFEDPYDAAVIVQDYNSLSRRFAAFLSQSPVRSRGQAFFFRPSDFTIASGATTGNTSRRRGCTSTAHSD